LGWNLWLATDNYDDAPKIEENNTGPQGSIAPIAESFKSPWIGSTIEDCAKWLREAPPGIAVDRNYFTAIDIHSKEEDTVLVCHRLECPGSLVDVDYFPQSTDMIAMQMWTNLNSKFDEKADCYQAQCREDGSPDRSKVGRYDRYLSDEYILDL
jgi:hypothetical protein